MNGGCKEKRKYNSKKEAYDQLAYLHHTSGHRLNYLKVYKCKNCKKWHLAKNRL